MNYEVRTISVFERQAKRLIKKFPSLKKELFSLTHSLSQDPRQGTPIGKTCYKIRLAISDKGKGKSGGARVITYVAIADHVVYLLTIYDKSDKEDLTQKELEELLKIISG